MDGMDHGNHGHFIFKRNPFPIVFVRPWRPWFDDILVISLMSFQTSLFRSVCAQKSWGMGYMGHDCPKSMRCAEVGRRQCDRFLATSLSEVLKFLEQNDAVFPEKSVFLGVEVGVHRFKPWILVAGETARIQMCQFLGVLGSLGNC